MFRRHPLTAAMAIVLALGATFVASRWESLRGALAGLGLYLAASTLMARAGRPAPRRPRPASGERPHLRVVDPPPYDWARRGRW